MSEFFEQTTMVPVTWHAHGGAILIRRKWRCKKCGHRLAVNGVAPVETRKQSPVTWWPELRDRREARKMG